MNENFHGFIGKHKTDESGRYEPSPKTKEFIQEASKDISLLKQTIFGNKEIGEKGMKEKVDDMHEILTQLKGWKSLGLIIIFVASVIVVLKGWLK